MAEDTLSIMPLRFRINRSALEGLELSVLDCDWHRRLMSFMQEMAQLDGRRIHRNIKPPYALFNTALLAMSPVVVHGLIGFQYNQIMALAACPTESMVREVALGWVEQWSQKWFANVKDAARRIALSKLYEGLASSRWRMIAANEALTDGKLRYRAIPSLLASLLAGKQSKVGDRLITWQLTQYSDQLALVSDLPSVDYAAEDNRRFQGTFAHLLVFNVQDQAGDGGDVWVHLDLHCRRYLDKPVKRLNYFREASVLVRIAQPRRDGWPFNNSLVRVPIWGGAKRATWANDLSDLLRSLHGRPLALPQDILQDPQKFRLPDQSSGDQYYILHAEGFRPKHGLKTGFSMIERAEIGQSVADLFAKVLASGKALLRDEATFSPTEPIMLLSPKRLEKRMITQMPRGLEKEEKLAFKADEQRRRREAATQHALGNRPAKLMILWHSVETCKTLLWALRELYALDDDAPWPDGLQVICHNVPGNLIQQMLPDHEAPTLLRQPNLSRDRRQELDDQWQTDLRVTRRLKSNQWRTFLSELDQPVDDSVGLAIIEIPHVGDDEFSEAQSIYGPVRDACVSVGILSQMINPIEVTLDEILAGRFPIPLKISEARGRAQNAVKDLMLRQTGTVYEPPADNLYRLKAGLSADVASNLTVLGLYRHRGVGGKVDFPMAVRLLPDGEIQARLPDEEVWLPYYAATMELGRRYQAGRALLTSAQLSDFVRAIFDEITEPTLVLLTADDWRTKIWPQMTNRNMRVQELDFRSDQYQNIPLVRPADRPGLRVIRIREAGSLSETPDYVATAHDDWSTIDDAQHIEHAALFIDDDHSETNPFPHFFSAGEFPVSAGEQPTDVYKHELGANIAFKYQTLVELVPFFWQPGDQPIQLSRVAHFLRRSPAWDGGNLVLPFPIHLARTANEDFECLVGSSASEEDEGQ